MLYSLLKPLLFRMDAEKTHHFTLSVVARFQNSFWLDVTEKFFSGSPAFRNSRNFMGLTFKNPLGLAAGLDKNAEVFPFFGALGFGFVEVGTITPLPQEGNPPPRLFRLIRDYALLNRMGFNNVGAEQAARNMEKLLPLKNTILGINIGKNKNTPNHLAHQDYSRCIEILHPFADYFVVNVSSPNTPGLRQLLDKEFLQQILESVMNTLHKHSNRQIPILLKISPDMDEESAEPVVSICSQFRLKGMVATNTTISRKNLPHYSTDELEKLGDGGISGSPLKDISNQWIARIKQLVPADFCIIGSGGIMQASDAIQKIKHGADLIQLYTGLIYHGPALIKKILKTLAYEKL